MSTRFDFEAYDEQPFFYEDEDEEEVGRSRRSAIRGSSFAGRAGSRFGGKRKKRPRPRIKFPGFGRGGLSPIAVFPGLFVEPGKEPTGQKPGKDSAPSGMPSPPPESDSPSEGSEFIRWAQVSLNKVLNLSLRTDGVIDADTREAIRSFQRREKLPVTGVIGPDTQQALVAATRNQAKQPDQEFPWWPSFFPALAPIQIEDRTAFGLKENRKGKPRDMSKVYALVLHQTAFSRGNDTTKYDRIPVHFVITPNGKIIQLHPLSAYLWSSNGFNAGSVAVEFVGNFPNTKGKCWQAQKFGCHQLTQEQINSGRALIRHLINTMGLTHVLAHRQSSGQRENDPGPDVWYHVGQWAVDNLGMKDGGPGFKVGSGNSIPDLWRKWGQAKPQPELEFSGYEFDGYGELEGELSFGSPLRAARKVNPKFVSCNPPSAAIKAITGADPVDTIQKANTRAIKLLDKVINDLQDARKKIIGGAAASSPTITDDLANALKNRFKMTASNRAIWTRQGSGTVDVLIRRFRGARQILADGWMKYTCLGAPTVTLGNCRGDGCPLDDPKRRAAACGGHSRIVLCKAWWSDNLDDQAAILLHECLHIYFGFIGDQEQGNRANAHCYAHFVIDLNGLPVSRDLASSCP